MITLVASFETFDTPCPRWRAGSTQGVWKQKQITLTKCSCTPHLKPACETTHPLLGSCNHRESCKSTRESQPDKQTQGFYFRLKFSLPRLPAVAPTSLPVALADVASVTDVALRLLRSRGPCQPLICTQEVQRGKRQLLCLQALGGAAPHHHAFSPPLSPA